MFELIGQILETKESKNINGDIYYLIRFLLPDNKVCVMFFRDKSLYEKLKSVSRLCDMSLICAVSYKDDKSFRLIPKDFNM